MSKDCKVILLISAALVVFLLFFITIVVIATSRVDEVNKDKLILIGSNSLGCNKYRYNLDVFWRCPPELSINKLSINNFEEQRCQSSGRVQSCTTEVLPVIK